LEKTLSPETISKVDSKLVSSFDYVAKKDPIDLVFDSVDKTIDFVLPPSSNEELEKNQKQENVEDDDVANTNVPASDSMPKRVVSRSKHSILTTYSRVSLRTEQLLTLLRSQLPALDWLIQAFAQFRQKTSDRFVSYQNAGNEQIQTLLSVANDLKISTNQLVVLLKEKGADSQAVAQLRNLAERLTKLQVTQFVSRETLVSISQAVIAAHNQVLEATSKLSVVQGTLAKIEENQRLSNVISLVKSADERLVAALESVAGEQEKEGDISFGEQVFRESLVANDNNDTLDQTLDLSDEE